MACGTEDRVDGVAFGPREVVTFEMPVLFEVADDRLDPGSPTQSHGRMVGDLIPRVWLSVMSRPSRSILWPR